MIMQPLIALLDGSTDDYNLNEKFGFDKYLENRSNSGGGGGGGDTSGFNRRASSPFLPGANTNMFSRVA